MLSRNKERLLARLKGGRSRSKEGLFAVEGVRCAEEALKHGVEIKFAVCGPRLEVSSRGLKLAKRIEREVRDATWVDDPTLELLSHTESPQGVVLVCREPTVSLEDILSSGSRERESGAGSPQGPLRLLMLDGIQDPGNLGALVRNAAAFGLSGVVALPGTVDPWNSKSVRASAGSCFMIPLVRASVQESLDGIADRGIPVLVAEMAGDEVGSFQVDDGWALVIGSEADGASDSVVSAADRLVSIPMVGSLESLNAAVAGGILLYALTREKRAK